MSEGHVAQIPIAIAAMLAWLTVSAVSAYVGLCLLVSPVPRAMAGLTLAIGVPTTTLVANVWFLIWLATP